MNTFALTTAELLGPLNAIDLKQAPKHLYLEAVNLPSGAV
ncbi:hypothetical protein THIOKS13190005 [Thiocapsa sp. KS1]|jgi:hypothetical protein|nr:hypothetical protein THIOKS13190005 [Thiocapsa sp. KS1]